MFFDRFRQSLALGQRSGERVGVLSVHMDGLKPINDQYGHQARDAAIREVSSRIAKISRKADTVARPGGDEFGAILTRIKDREGGERQ